MGRSSGWRTTGRRRRSATVDVAASEGDEGSRSEVGVLEVHVVEVFDGNLMGWEDGIEPAIDITLAGRHYERFADHAVSVARRVVYLVTGQRPDLQD